MPITYQPPGHSKSYYLSPAPFVSISKQYEKMDNGEIVGVRYSISLQGTLLADRGSPRHKPFTGGAAAFDVDTDITDGRVAESDENQVPADDTGWPGLEFVSSTDVSAGADPDEVEQTAINPSQWYLSLQRKQISIMNMFSKENEGGELVITSPGAGGATGWKCYPRIMSVDFPSHDPGRPNMSTFSVELEADYLIGPDGTSDLDDFRHHLGVTGRTKRWLVSGASESWEIDEYDSYSIRGLGKDNTDFAGANARGQINAPEVVGATGIEDLDNDSVGDMIQSFDKVYVLTHSINAAGKPRFNDGFGQDTGGVNNKALTAASRLKDNNFSKQYQQDENGNSIGEAWQQARGFIYDILEYQRARRFTEGEDLIEDSGSITFGQKFNDLDFLGLNIPTDANATPFEKYKGFNYRRTQSVDVSGGSFSITETWILSPEGKNVVETIDFSVSDGEDGLIDVSLSGSIQGLNDIFVDFTAETDEDDGAYDEAAFRDEFNNLSQPSPNMDIHDDTTPADSANSGVANSKYENAEIYYNNIHGMLYRVAENYVNRLKRYNNYDKTTQDGTRTNIDGKGYIWGIKLHPKPTSSSVALSPSTGAITYDMSFNNRKTNYIPWTVTEDIDIQDTYPGQVFGSTAVIGRAAGPVLQNIGTQTQWERSLSISCQVDVNNYYVVDDAEYGMANAMDSSGDIDGVDFDDSTDGLNAAKATKNPNNADNQHRTTAEAPDTTAYHESLSANQKGDDVGTRPAAGAEDVDGSTHGAGWAVGKFDSNGNVVQGNNGENLLAQGASDFNANIDNRVWGSSGMAKRPSQVDAQLAAIKEIINAYRPLQGIEGVKKVFMNAPNESWNPKTGSWAFNVSWIYEMTNDPFGGSYTKYGYDSSNAKQYHHRERSPYPGGSWDGRAKATTQIKTS
jgi:hypothetical protein